MNPKHLAIVFSLFFYASSLSQNENKVIGTWAFLGNDVYLYDFADSGKVSITTCMNIANPTVIADGWRIADGLFYMKDKKKTTYREHSYTIVEITDSKMILNYSPNDIKLEFHKIKPNKNLKIKLSEDWFLNKSFSIAPTLDTLVNKISFGEYGHCTLHSKTAAGEVVKSESRWSISNREDNLFLIIDDFEILVFKSKNENNSVLEFTSYGFYRVISGIESVTLKTIDLQIKN